MHDSSPSTAPPPKNLLVPTLSLFHFWCVQATHLTVSVLFTFSSGFHRRFGSTKVITIGSIRQFQFFNSRWTTGVEPSTDFGNIFQHEFHRANDVCWVNQSIISYLKTAKRFSSTPKNPTNDHNQKKHKKPTPWWWSLPTPNMHIERFQSRWPSWMTIAGAVFISDAFSGVRGLTASLTFVAGADAQAGLGWTQGLFQDGRDHHLRSPIFMAGVPMMSNTPSFFLGCFADPRTWRSIKISSYKCCAMVQKSGHDWKLGHKVTTSSVLGWVLIPATYFLAIWISQRGKHAEPSKSST